jgi:hypothetical protein
VKELDHAPNGPIDLDRSASAEVVAGDHSNGTVPAIIRLCQSRVSTGVPP